MLNVRKSIRLKSCKDYDWENMRRKTSEPKNFTNYNIHSFVSVIFKLIILLLAPSITLDSHESNESTN